VRPVGLGARWNEFKRANGNWVLAGWRARQRHGRGNLNRIVTFALSALVFLNASACRRNRFPWRRYFIGHGHVTKIVSVHHKASAELAPMGASAQESANDQGDLSTPEMDWYPWIKYSSSGRPKAQSALKQRFPEPPGYQRIAVNPETLGEWLRHLPIAAPGTVVNDANGKAAIVTLAGFVAAVVAIDMHAEESADALLRLHAEWRFSKGDRESISYASNSGRMMPFARWIGGERIVLKKQDWDWAVKAAPLSNPTYMDLRNFLDAAYQWTDPSALAIQGKVLDATDVAPGDYFVHAGKDPTLVIVLDVAKNSAGEPALLLAHVASPHQYMYVMRASKQSAWFTPRANQEIAAPGLKPFVWREHHRLPKAMIGKPF